MIHVIKGAEVQRSSTTLCGKLLEDLPRNDQSVAYALRAKSDCPVCGGKVERIERMRSVKD